MFIYRVYEYLDKEMILNGYFHEIYIMFIIFLFISLLDIMNEKKWD